MQPPSIVMDLSQLKEMDGVQKDLFYLGVCALVIASTAAVSNLYTPEEPVRVGYTEIETECVGLDAGVCIGIQRQDHTTYNYDNYNQTEPGTENYYRRVESELMLQAYNICNADMSGYEWTDEAEYMNQTGTEWRENENVELLPCSETFYRNISAAE